MGFLGRKKKGQGDLFGLQGKYIFMIQSYPRDRICPGCCKNHRIEVKDKFLHLKYTNSINEHKEFVYTLTQSFNEGTLKIYLKEEAFNKIILNLQAGSIAVRNRRKILINNSFYVPIKGYDLEKRY